MSQGEVILKEESGVKDHESESPPTVGLKAGAFAELGTLILTNRRLVFISKAGDASAAAWAVGTVFTAQAIEKRVSKAELDELTTQEGSYSTPIQNITRVEAGRKMGQSYIRVDGVNSRKTTHSYVVDGGFNNQDWVNSINQAKATLKSPVLPQANIYTPQSTQSVSLQTYCQKCGEQIFTGSKFCVQCGTPVIQNRTEQNMPPPPPPSAQTPTCPYYGNQIRYIEQYQRWYCDKEKRYV